jgi:hypothetical protein
MRLALSRKEAHVGLLDRFRARSGGAAREELEVAQYLADWSARHRGVEAFVEPTTTVTAMTVVLVAHDGEWTRRAIGDARRARKLGEDLGIPVYDVRKVGYPQRMRDYDARRKIERRREQERRDIS